MGKASDEGGSLPSIAARGAAISLTAQALKFTVQLSSIVALARLLEPDDFGLFAIALAVGGLALILSNFGLSLATIQAASVSDAQRSNVFWLNLSIGVACAVGTLPIGELLARIYDRPELAHIMHGFAFIFITQAAAAQFLANASKSMRFGLLALQDVTAQLAALLVGVLMAFGGAGYWALVGQRLTASVIGFVILAWVGPWRPSWPSRAATIRPFISFGASTLGVQVLNHLSSNVDSLILGRSAGPSQLGAYDRAYQIFNIPVQQLAAPMTRVALPVLSPLTGTDSFQAYVVRAQLVLCYLVGLAFAFAAGVSYPLLSIILGPGWDVAIDVFPILAIGGLFQTMAYVYHWAFMASGRTGLQFRLSIVSRFAMIAGIVVGANWGVYGVSAAVASGLAFDWLIQTIIALPRLGLDRRIVPMPAVRPLILYVTLGTLSHFLTQGPLIRLNPFLSIGLTAAAWVAVSAVVITVLPSYRQDYRQLVETGRRIRKRSS